MLKHTLSLEIQMIKVSVIPLENNVFRNDKNNESNIPKEDRFKKLQVSFKDLHPEAHQPNIKKKIPVIGKVVSRGDSVKI